MAKSDFGCGRPECHVSTGICGRITFGTGELDDYGYFEVGCDKCARAWEKLHPGEKAWPQSAEDLEKRFIEFEKGTKD